MTIQSTQAQHMAPDASHLDQLLALQPVYARNLDVKAFDMLLENPASTWALNDVQSLHQVLVESYTSIYQQGQMRTLPCFLRVNDAILRDLRLPDLPHNQYILDVDGANISPDIGQRLRELAAQGYLLALSNMHLAREDLSALFKVIHILRLDIAALEGNALDNALARLKPYGLDLFADKLPGPELYRRCLDEGFQYFRGDFLGPPQSVKGRMPGNNVLVLTQVMAELGKPNFNMDCLVQIAIQDPSLTFKFLKAANAASYGSSGDIQTLQQALNLLGKVQIKRWLSLFLLESNDDRPTELSRQMLIRGRMCEMLAEVKNRPSTVSYFLAGLLSQLDALTGIPLPDLMDNVSLNQDIKQAVLHRKGVIGDLLAEVEYYEQGRFDRLTALTDRSYYEIAYRHSTTWAQELLMSKTSH